MKSQKVQNIYSGGRMARTKSGAKKILLIFTAANTLVILSVAVLFSFIVRSDTTFMRGIILNYASRIALEKAQAAAAIPMSAKKPALKDFTNRLYDYCATDPRIFNIIIFSKTADENFFRVASKYDAVKTIEVEPGQRVREESEENYLKKGIYEPVTNPNLFSDKSSYWHNAYIPLTLKEGSYVARFMISSSDAVISLEDYFMKSRRIAIAVAIIAGLVIAFTLAASFLFLRNFSLYITGITGYAKKAVNGDHDISLNEKADEDISELALSFNTLVGELREKEKKIQDLKDKESAAIKKAKDSPADAELQKELNGKIEELKIRLADAQAEKEKIVKESQKSDELSDSFRKGVELLKANNLSDATTVFLALTILKPDGFGAWFNLGVVYAKMRMIDSAMEMFEKALSLNPSHELVASYLEKLKRIQAATKPDIV